MAFVAARYLFVATLFTLTFVSVRADDLPDGVVNSQNAADQSLSPEESLARIRVPDGFRVTLFAGEPDIRRPIAFDFDDRGRLWVVENYSHPQWKTDGASDRVVILEDLDNDGKFDSRKVFWDKGRYLTGIAVGHGGVWLANTPELTFIPDHNRDDVPDDEPRTVLDGFQKSTNNVFNNLHWGPDGWLYGAIGLSSESLVGSPLDNDPLNRTPITRGIWRFHPQTFIFQKVAEGMVNPWGADFNEYGDLFTSNTVLAHLWHIVPGMYCERRASEEDNPYAYARIQSIANHLHWGGGAWNESRNPSSQKKKKGKDGSTTEKPHADREHEYHQHSVAGGGHAHCGAMIYLGDNWPEKYRGTFFTNNLHGNRVNNDRLLPNRSSYVATHADDFMYGNDEWFRGMSIKCGPDGGVYVSDWHDFGECHDSDGSHRSSGRIYKIVYGKTSPQRFDLHEKSDTDLAAIHTHPNEWFVRHARRILHERSVYRFRELAAAAAKLKHILAEDGDIVVRLRAIFTLHTMGHLDDEELFRLLADPEEHIRKCAVSLLIDDSASDMSSVGEQQKRLPRPSLRPRFETLAAKESSAVVRLALASALQHIHLPWRLPLANALLSHPEDATDPYIPLMIWYGLEPAVMEDPEAAVNAAVAWKIPQVRNFTARRIADIENPNLELIAAAACQSTNTEVILDLLLGMRDALEGRGSQVQPESWPKLYSSIREADSSELRAVAVQLATIFGDEAAISDLRAVVTDKSRDIIHRREAFAALLPLNDAVPVTQLHRLVSQDATLREESLQALMTRSNSETSEVLLRAIPGISMAHQQLAVAVLATRRDFARQLLTAIAAGAVERDSVSSFTLQQLRSYRDEDISKHIAEIWADDSTLLNKAEELQRLTELMTPKYVASGDASAGRLLFQKTCIKCHTLFGEGGTIAPDLTGSGRKKPDYVLRNLIDPSAEIDEAYRLTTVVTVDGRLLTGFIVKQDDTWLELRTQDARIRTRMKDVDELNTSGVSMMPENMIRGFTDEQIRDLLQYLSSEEQVAVSSRKR